MTVSSTKCWPLYGRRRSFHSVHHMLSTTVWSVDELPTLALLIPLAYQVSHTLHAEGHILRFTCQNRLFFPAMDIVCCGSSLSSWSTHESSPWWLCSQSVQSVESSLCTRWSQSMVTMVWPETDRPLRPIICLLHMLKAAYSLYRSCPTPPIPTI